MGTSFLALDACGASIHTSPEKVKKKNLKKKPRCKVLPLLQLWWPTLAQLQILLQLQVPLHPTPTRMGRHTLWPLFTSAIWPRMSLRPCFSKNSPLLDPFCPSESAET